MDKEADNLIDRGVRMGLVLSGLADAPTRMSPPRNIMAMFFQPNKTEGLNDLKGRDRHGLPRRRKKGSVLRSKR